MRKIEFKNPVLTNNETTELTSNHASGVTTLTVANTVDFVADDFILIEKEGNEEAEVRQISSITDEVTIVITAATDFAHDTDTTITKLDFNQMKLYNSAIGDTYNLVETKDIDYQDEKGLTIFIHSAGLNTDYYRVDYFNSQTSDTIQNDIIQPITLIGYITLDDFKNETGLKGLTDNFMEHAIRHGAQEIKRRLYTPRKVNTQVEDTEHQLPYDEVSKLELADANLDNAIDKNDVTAYQEATDGVRTDVTSDISGLNRDRWLVTFSTARPTDGEELVIKYFVAPRRLEDMDEALREINKLYAINFLFTNVPFRKLQRGISSYTLNGVNINFDRDGISQVIQSNIQRVTAMIDRLHRVYLRGLVTRRPRFDLFEFRSTLRFK